MDARVKPAHHESKINAGIVRRKFLSLVDSLWTA
jgi:hypothetical protein